jgi:hypothetical protein
MLSNIFIFVSIRKSKSFDCYCSGFVTIRKIRSYDLKLFEVFIHFNCVNKIINTAVYMIASTYPRDNRLCACSEVFAHLALHSVIYRYMHTNSRFVCLKLHNSYIILTLHNLRLYNIIIVHLVGAHPSFLYVYI